MVMTKALRQHIRSLKQRRSRWEHEQILVEGEKCIAELCKSDWSVERIYFTTPWEGADFWSGLEGVTPDIATLVSSKDMNDVRHEDPSRFVGHGQTAKGFQF